MTDEATTPTAPCNSCGAPVGLRRPSLTGAHFCSKTECKAAKQRYYYTARKEGSLHQAKLNAEIKERHQRDLLAALIRALVSGPRVHCEACDRTDALPGYVHTDLVGGPCNALRTTPMPEGMGPTIVAAIWQDVAPKPVSA